MAQISGQKIRAKITVGNVVVQTPDVVSFSVRRARSQMAATFSASLRVPYTISSEIGADIVIEAGLKGALKTIFTGTVERSTINPIRTDASMVMLNISGRDVLAVMDGQKINRRVKAYRTGEGPPERWGVINSVIKHNTSKMEKFPIHITDHRPKAVQDLPQYQLDTTPDAFKLEAAVDRAISDKTYGGIEITKITE